MYYEQIKLDSVPNHVAIIMDGNGRWAKKRGLPRTLGHREGMKRVIEIVEAASEINIKSLSLYAFSTENWKRPKEEISKLMELLIIFIRNELNRLCENNVKLNILGDIKALSMKVQKEVEEALSRTSANDKMILNIGLNYGGQVEIRNACKNIVSDVLSGKLSVDEIDLKFSNYLYTKHQDEVDLMIRPSGEMRLSNFMLYQVAYGEFYFSDILWPDFHKEDFYKAIVEYQNRNRRFGGL